MFRAMVENAQPRLHGLLGIDAYPAAPVWLIDLDRAVHHIADEKTFLLAVQQPERHMARRVDRLTKNPSLTLEQAAAAESRGAPYAARLMRPNYLAPAIVVSILTGRQPAAFTANKWIADTRLPPSWDEQRKALGFD